MRLLLPLSCAGVLLTAGVLCAQNTGAPAPESGDMVIRTETRVVLVDAVAVDKKNQFVLDLAQKDFRLWEDGKEQKIASFSLESAGISPERSNKHYIAMLFDTSTAGQTSQVEMRTEATHFIDSFASADRYMAVVNYANGLQIEQNFTADAARLKKALGMVQSTAASSAGLMGDSARPNSISTLGTQVDTSPYRNLLASLRSLATSLGTIKGRKALVLFSGGANMSTDLEAAVTATVAACNKANVAVYAVGGATGGTADKMLSGGTNYRTTNADIAKLNQTDSGQSLLGVLADGTGGLMFKTTNDLANSLGKVALEQDQYYLIGYTPLVEAAEGTCHELNLKVDRGDLEIRARKSYCTSKPVDPLSGKPAGQALETRAAGGAAGSIMAKMELPWFYAAAGIAQVDLAMDIIPSAMKFQKEKGKLHGEFNLAGVAYKPDGSAGARFSDTVKLDFDTQKQADEFLKAPYHYLNQFKIGPGNYNFRVAFSSEGADNSGAQGFGKVEMPLVVEPWNGQTLGASGLALSRDAHESADIAAGLDASLLEGQRSLIAKGTEVVPTGDSRFRAGEPGFVYFEIYEPLLATATAAVPIGVRIRVLDSGTGQPKMDSGVKTIGSFERPGNPVVPIVSPLPSGNLGAGEYRLEVSVMRATGDPVVRTADFSVN